jgi:hypothetical protein
MTPTGSFSVPSGQSKTLAISLSPGYASKINTANTTCPNAPAANSAWIIGPITNNCSVAVTFYPNPTITASAGAGGTISPSGTFAGLSAGGTKDFTIKPNSGYNLVTPVGGTCSGTFNSNTNIYTANVTTGSCTVAASFSNSYTVTASTSGTGGSMTPTGSVSVISGQSQTFSVTLSSGYASKYDTTNTTCHFSGASSNKWTFGPITQNCKVALIFYHT